jgi:hypothetical protein
VFAAADLGQTLVRIPEVGTALQPTKLSRVLPPTALGSWTVRDLTNLLANVDLWVEYSLTGLFAPRPEVNEGQFFRKCMPAREALERIAFEGHYSVNYYISALPLDKRLDKIAGRIPQFVNGTADPPPDRVLFIGNTGTGSCLHYDLPDNLMLVLAGEKHFLTFSPDCSDDLAPYSTEHRCCNFSTLSDAAVRRLATSLGSERAFEITVRAGEILYMPSCWWHRTTNHGLTVGVAHLWAAPSAEREHESYRRYDKNLRPRLRFDMSASDKV